MHAAEPGGVNKDFVSFPPFYDFGIAGYDMHSCGGGGLATNELNSNMMLNTEEPLQTIVLDNKVDFDDRPIQFKHRNRN